MEEREQLCPRCGAYWQCNCRLEELSLPGTAGCEHDWAEAIGVELDDDIGIEAPQIVVCRLCGLYAVKERV